MDRKPNESNFDYWVRLYETNKVEFEQKRLEYISNEIDKMDIDEVQRQRYKAMCWRFEQDLRTYKDDTARFNRVVELFWKQFKRFQESLNQIK